MGDFFNPGKDTKRRKTEWAAMCNCVIGEGCTPRHLLPPCAGVSNICEVSGVEQMKRADASRELYRLDVCQKPSMFDEGIQLEKTHSAKTYFIPSLLEQLLTVVEHTL